MAHYREKNSAGPAAIEIDWLLQAMTRARRVDVDCARPAQLRQWLDIAERHLARERNKGVARHWSYDLNRHIALKQARDHLRCLLSKYKAPAPAEK